ncbi:MAG: hypothetical protein Q7R59_00470 [bacterium]|nr:hypothetical protein [bacterium]
MAGSSREFSDAKKDFIQCYELFLDSNRTQDQKSSGGPEDETGEQYLLRTKPSIDKISVKINEILDKYSDDPRFNVDYHKLVAEIREDFAKYKAERFPTT